VASKTIFRALGIEFKFGGIEFTREPVGVPNSAPTDDADGTAQSSTALTTLTEEDGRQTGIPRWLRPLGPCPYMKLYCIVMTVALLSAFGVVMYNK
jgi:hypothetical protein